ncbi:50S ribosomal protein L4 [Penicillium chermesinum]|uniref:Large ribosomal subunit protein uL4m n=1 Tax=Penicillium chermesinum TaxID=63820 RepID=A0A9W9PGU2_9EURO|nr:50S ribosomal protein L4 [Penicillium chermesinum]KAJ5246601.1 50S ribosomal protein L4 [Penicillium chermesinum]
MPGSDALRALRLLSRSSSGLWSGAEAVMGRCLTRSMATEASANGPSISEVAKPPAPWDAPVSIMTYAFPSMEPVRLVQYSQKELQLPIRKDILHRAVVYEGDNTRQGSANAKWRGDVHGSHRKLLPQKGSGRARVGDKMSPIRRGGGVAHGPHPRDFGTDLPRKIYDQAWRIALSYRFSRGELIVIDNKISLPAEATPYLIQNYLHANGWGTKNGRSTFITKSFDEELFEKVSRMDKYATIRDLKKVDVKNLLETSRLIIEKQALDKILAAHSKDLRSRPASAFE